MMIRTILPLTIVFGIVGCGPDEAAEGSPPKESGHTEDNGERINIAPASAAASDIGLATAGTAVIQEVLHLSGRIALQPQARVEIHAPYPGPVRQLFFNVGDLVKRGEILARVESSDSLQIYAITTPIAGSVLERQTSIGDITHDDPIFVIGDLTQLQAELNVTTRDVPRVVAGQQVIISGVDGINPVETSIATVLPTADAHSQTLIARAPIRTDTNSYLRPGMAIQGAVVLAQEDVAIAVPETAVQTLEGRSVVFVRVSPNMFQARVVSVGRAGLNNIEIKSGLKAGDIYVARNAFLVKAEMGKGSAGHDD